MSSSAKGKGKTASSKVVARDFEPRQGQVAAKSRGSTSHTAISITSDQDDDDEDDFEEVPIPNAGESSRTRLSSGPVTPGSPGRQRTGIDTPGTNTTAPSVDDDFEGYGDEEEEGEEKDDGVIRLTIGGENEEEKAKRIALAMRKKPMTSKDRAIRLEAHKMHAICLIASARLRNRWASNQLLRARLLSLLPHPLQTAFVIPPAKFPDRAHRSRLFFDALQALVTWWSQSFYDISDNFLGLRTRPWDEVQEIIDQLPKLTKADFLDTSFLSKGKAKATNEEIEERLEKLGTNAGGERLRTVNSLMKKALKQEGSRDVSAILFVSLARACGLGVRLVTSLQAVPWRAEKVTAKKKTTGAGKGGKSLASRQGNGQGTEDEEEEDDEEDMEEVYIPLPEDAEGGPGEIKEKIAKTKTRQAGRRRHIDPADVYRLRAPKPAPKTVAPAKKKPSKLDLMEQPPVFWAEVYSRSDSRWIPVDPLNGTIRKKADYEPTSDSGPIRMTYVLAFEEDGYARDVTLRYTKNFGAKTAKLRPPPRKDEPDWWSEVTGFLKRPYQLMEDAELETSQFSEGMPNHMSGFKDHPIYVLERHLKREEVIQPKREIGRFRGEPVFRRLNVLSCKTSENWMRIGRKVREKQEPLKWVKQRAVTIQKRRAQELALQENGEGIQQGLYAEYQTAVYIPPPIKDGVIPTNSFGNIDLYAPTMLPPGAVHLPYKGIAKVAKKLQISYAEACTGFEFKNQRAIPVITGIVVAIEQKELVMDAYEESAQAAEERERIKKEEKALKRWVKLINGLRVRRRLQAEYGQSDNLNEQSHNPLAMDAIEAPPVKVRKSAKDVIANTTKEAAEKWAEDASDEEITPPPTPLVAEVKSEPEPMQVDGGDEIEVQEQVAIAEAREQGEVKSEAEAEAEEEIEIPAPPARSIRLRMTPNSSARAGKRKGHSPPTDTPPTKSRATTRVKKEPVPRTPTSAPTRSLRSRAPKSEEQQQADRIAQARIRAALDEDDNMDMEEDE